MNERDALFLCNRVRYHTGIFDRSLLRDGFSTDMGEADRDALSAINDTLRLLFMTGQFVCRFTLELTADTSEYTKDPDMGLVKAIWYQDKPLEHTSMLNLNSESKMWLTQASSTPSKFYTDIPDVIGLYPAPDETDDADDPSLVILAEVVADDLEEPDDVPTRLPSAYHEGVAIGASILVLSSLGMNTEKIEVLGPMWKKYLDAVQANAQRGEYASTDQLLPFDYRKRNRRP